MSARITSEMIEDLDFQLQEKIMELERLWKEHLFQMEDSITMEMNKIPERVRKAPFKKCLEASLKSQTAKPPLGTSKRPPSGRNPTGRTIGNRMGLRRGNSRNCLTPKSSQKRGGVSTPTPFSNNNPTTPQLDPRLPPTPFGGRQRGGDASLSVRQTFGRDAQSSVTVTIGGEDKVVSSDDDLKAALLGFEDAGLSDMRTIAEQIESTMRTLQSMQAQVHKKIRTMTPKR
eukprot:TRINITY_DN6571_c0_g1_i1.p1 TRINITY_DN6571_c0_g1~~TRINITY_DN6571_c0_g1_i1.p1  ORF type:complete len:230 (+),score=53.61 TRINITY_DN6571_c0_g1_i1:57-746(+)